MSGLTKQTVKGSNCNELLPNDDGTLTVRGTRKIDILEANDVVRAYTWAPYAGVRKVTSIVFTSAAVDAYTGQTNVVTRTFVYGAGPHFDLQSETDVLVST